MNRFERLHGILLAAGVDVITVRGSSVEPLEVVIRPGAGLNNVATPTTVLTQDGVAVIVSTVDNAPVEQAVLTAIIGADLSALALANDVKARTRTAASPLLLVGASADNVATRSAVTTLWTHGRNDVAEGLYARFVLLCERLNVAVPTDAEVAAKIITLRNGIDPGIAAVTVAHQSRRRLIRAEIVELISLLLAAGGGDAGN